MRLFVGKGGAGTSTVAAATAVAAASPQHPVLLVSLDQASSLSDLFGLDRAPGVVRSVADGLDILEIDSLALLEQRFAALARLLAAAGGGHEHAAGFALPAPEEITGVPGLQEVFALHEIARLTSDGRRHTVVVDCPSGAAAFGTLAAPRMAADYVERIWPRHSRIEAATGPDLRLGFVVALFDRMMDRLGEITDLLADRRRTSVTLVGTADRVSAAELRRLRSWTALSGLRLDGVIVNGLVPDFGAGTGPAADWLAAQRRTQRSVLDDIVSSVGDVPVLECERQASEPVGLASLGAFARALYRDDRDVREPAAADTTPIRVQHESGTGVDSVYTMRMHLPLADPATLTLGRVDDDLVVGADGIRRRVRLASGLRRCTVSGAEFDGGDLVVRFVPDPAVWPQ
ncbi:ArsA family ATPase [Rhodococcus sp. HM1]|uniref:ArsA family ATPase n=1 Tax=Rhodococcus sp. HM1 TaxID=2937759 RepID=UPI00200A98C1|nr:ArsA-related P-loop ATPase [Rhodococcus sp. HM1]MCK8670793.1 ArsA family ATPase [Rhodococcus sp. HM1]